MLDSTGVDEVPEVRLLAPAEVGTAPALRRKGIIAFRREAVVPPSSAKRKTETESLRSELAEKKAAAIAQILDSWGILKGLSYSEQEQLIRQLVEIALFGGDE